MRTIHVTEWDQVSIEGELEYQNEGPVEKLLEGTVYSVEFTNIETSHPLNEEESVILNCCNDHTFGDAVLAVDRALELAMLSISHQETCSICITVSGSYVSHRLVDQTWTLSCSIKLTIKSAGKRSYEFTGEEKIAKAQKMKDFGVDLLKKSDGNYLSSSTMSFLCFAQAIKWCVITDYEQIDNSQKDFVNTIKTNCYNNIAQYHNHVKQYDQAVIAAGQVIRMDPNNVKALYRRSIAYTYFQEYDKAKDDLNLALSIDPTNKTVKKQLELVLSKIKVLDAKFAAAMRKFWS